MRTAHPDRLLTPLLLEQLDGLTNAIDGADNSARVAATGKSPNQNDKDAWRAELVFYGRVAVATEA